MTADDRLSDYSAQQDHPKQRIRWIEKFQLFRKFGDGENYRLDTWFKVARFQLLFAARSLVKSSPLPRMNSRDMERYCHGIAELLADPTEAEMLFDRAAEVLADIEEMETFDRDAMHT